MVFRFKMFQQEIKKAAQILKNGGVVVFPTDTVFCMGASAVIDSAVKKIFSIKQRSLDKALPILISEKDDLKNIAEPIPDIVWCLGDKFWPGGLTIVLRMKKSFKTFAAAGKETIAVRIPNHYIPISIIKELGSPVTGTSANITGTGSITKVNDVHKQLDNKVDLIIDGDCPGGIESTIIDLSVDEPQVLRYGAIPVEVIEQRCNIFIRRENN
ncbi:MAG: L-threonylcarbamoyladenylate synthase [Chloroflexi bacterium]|nr:L-threonylcarbamoyladenylate synthase [Chloroflexota bacterium]